MNGREMDKQNKITTIEITPEILEQVILPFRNPIASERDPQPYVVISCNAYSWTAFIESVLQTQGIHIKKKYLYDGYIEYATCIYQLPQADVESHLWLAALLGRYGDAANTFQVWFLDDLNVNRSNLKSAKWEIRNHLGFLEKVVFKGQEFEIQNHYVHYPEAGEIAYEYNLLFNFTRKKIKP